MFKTAFDIYSIEELYDMTDLIIEEIDEDIDVKYSEDYLNRNNYRNSENTDKCDYNCGGFALNTFNWYKPYEGAFEWREQLLTDWAGDYYDQNGKLIEEPRIVVRELENRLLTRDVLYMLRQFRGKLRRVNGIEDLWEGERLVAYRIGIKYTYDEVEELFSDFDIDFHYRYFDPELGYWVEKLGGGPIRGCVEEEGSELPWTETFWKYTSDIVYFALQL